MRPKMTVVGVVERARSVEDDASTVALWSLLYVVVCTAGYVAADAFVTGQGVSVWFPPAALTFAYLVRVGPVGAPVVLLTRLFATVVFMGDTFRLGNMVVTSAMVVVAYTGVAMWTRRHLHRDRNYVRMMLVVVVGSAAAPLAAGLLVVSWVTATTSVTVGSYIDTLQSFWLGDASAVMTLAPALLIGPPLRWNRRGIGARERTAALAQMLAISVVAWVAVVPDPQNPRLYLTFVPLVWVAVAYGLTATTVSLAATGAIVPLLDLAQGVSDAEMTDVQRFLVVYALTGLVLGAAESDRRRVGRELEDSERRIRAEHRTTAIAERRFRLAFEAAPVGICLVATDGRFLSANDALCQILGYDADELVGMTFADITHPDDVDGDVALRDSVLGGYRDGYRREKRYLRKDGDTVIAQLDVVLVRDEDGEPLHFITQVQDITESRTMMESLQTAETMQRACLNALEQGIAMATLDGEVRLLNPAGEQLLGCSAAELTELVQSGRFTTYQEDGSVLPLEERPLRHTMYTGEPVSDRVSYWRRPDGELVAMRLATEPVRDDSGEMVGIVVAFADITAQRAAEKAEREALDRLEWQAFHDPLTGLANRALMLEHLEVCLADRRDREIVALLFIDLDDFKLVNDTLGHAAGDELLCGVAARLERAVRADDVVARFGGDEFVVLATDLTSRAGVEALALRITDELAAPIVLSTGAVTASASIGIAIADQQTADALLADADTALYRAKHEARGRHQLLGH